MDDQSEQLYQKVLKTFTKDAQKTLLIAQQKAQEAGMSYVGSEHILMGILSQRKSSGAEILMDFGVSLENVNLVIKTVRGEPQAKQKRKADILNGVVKKAIESAIQCANDFGHKMVGTTHLLYAFCSQEETAFTVILENMRVFPKEIIKRVIAVLQKNSDKYAAEKKKKWIDGYDK